MFKSLFIFCIIGLTALSSAEINVLAFAGSTRKASVNKTLVAEAAQIASQMNAHVTLIDLKDYPIPFYDADLEAQEGMPENVKKLRQLLKKSDLIFIASPEYNGFFSGLLKNAIDWSSRNETGGFSKDAFAGKKFLLLSASPGAGGGSRGLGHLKTLIENVGGTVLPQKFIVAHAYSAFDNSGHLKDSQKAKELQTLIEHIIPSSELTK